MAKMESRISKLERRQFHEGHLGENTGRIQTLNTSQGKGSLILRVGKK